MKNNLHNLSDARQEEVTWSWMRAPNINYKMHVNWERCCALLFVHRSQCNGKRFGSIVNLRAFVRSVRTTMTTIAMPLIMLSAQNYKITHHIIKFRPQKVNLRRNHFIKNNLHKIPISHLFYLFRFPYVMWVRTVTSEDFVVCRNAGGGIRCVYLPSVCAFQLTTTRELWRPMIDDENGLMLFALWFMRSMGDK